jgi:TonB family protein
MQNYAPAAPGVKCARNYQLTIIDTRTLIGRLQSEIAFLFDRMRRAWRELKSDPSTFISLRMIDYRRSVVRVLRRPNVLASSLAATVIVSLSILIAIYSDRTLRSADHSKQSELQLVELVLLNPTISPPQGSGIGAGSKGRVGFADGGGEGSRPEPHRSHGGGSSGNRDKTEAERGKLFQPSEIPATLPAPKNPVLPKAGIDLDPTLWKEQPLVIYGDPRSKSSSPSNGPGAGGNFGSGQGLGIGEGDGPGFWPGEKGNVGGGSRDPGGNRPGGSSGNNTDNPNRPFRASEVNQRARVLFKPEPQYTEEARRNQISGTVLLRVIFSASSQVLDIRTIHGLPFGLTEQAIKAARQIRFTPALKGDRPVSVYMQLEYNFNLY